MTELFTLAEQEGVQSRIIFSTDGNSYQAVYDEPEAWDSLQPHQPTLLVSDIEKWHPQAAQIMQWFPFIKNWRFDDLMMSYAPSGASVGAHTDHYDVFLLQVQGTRRWSYDDQPLAKIELDEDSEIAVIKNFQPQHNHELHPGDVLYLPPEIAHHGVSTSDDCVTCSIGLRAPSEAELLSSFIELYSQQTSADARFTDGVKQPNSDASIGQHEINYLRSQLLAISQMQEENLAKLFGQVVTSYRLFEETEYAVNTTANNANKVWQKSPFAVFAYHLIDASEASLMVNGEVFRTTPYTAQLICNQTSFQIDEIEISSNKPVEDLEMITTLSEMQAIIPA
ncbi:cupin domain-containing protein [Marinicella marina]|uniref:cupin domain-containing protein n=1 Tax=Marinicella marina TaxID=2996016 RepID=UPI002B205EDF|nr:cupin domain-containing protein [Marinicella marina]